MSSLSEEELRAVTVGEPAALNASVALADYDPAWPQRFRDEETGIRAALGMRVLRLEHTGSTSVPGLAAKPIIDVLLVVADPADEASYVPALEASGYVPRIREPDWHEHRCLVRRTDLGHDYDVNLHVHPPDSEEIRRQLAFRDWLRAHPDDRARYETTKRRLAARTWKYVQNYADAKTDVVEEILARALAGGS